MKMRTLAGFGLFGLALPVAGSAQQGSGDPARNWADIAQCGAIDGAEARHQCMDGVLRRAGVLSSERIVRETRQEFGRERRPEPPRPAPPPPRVAVAEPAEAAEMEELLTTIRSIRTIGFQTLRIVTAEGSVWEQTQARTFTSEPKVGDPFSAQKAALGSYRCKFASSARYRCQRVD